MGESTVEDLLKGALDEAEADKVRYHIRTALQYLEEDEPRGED